jgi:hypothetical protein
MRVRKSGNVYFNDPVVQGFYPGILGRERSFSEAVQIFKNIIVDIPPEIIYIDADCKRSVRCFDATRQTLRFIDLYKAYLNDKKRGVEVE